MLIQRLTQLSEDKLSSFASEATAKADDARQAGQYNLAVDLGYIALSMLLALDAKRVGYVR
jgi:hypothetical protein